MASLATFSSFEWHDEKERLNIEKHGVDFEAASFIFDGPVVTGLDDRFNYGEPRHLSFGEVDGRVLAVVWTPRGTDTCRIISARKADRNERKRYYETCARGATNPPD